MNDLRVEFNRLASDGYIGDIDGETAYAYLRASSEKQVEEGSSFPRQLENVSKAAHRDHLKIPFELVFFDDGYTGFEFEHRPALLRLRHELKTAPRAIHIIFEDIDRLSRNADWQQGFLLEEFSRHKLHPHFFINPGSQLERYVRGYIAQEGMKKDIERMRMGHVYKAMDGRVTAKRPRYGYRITHRKNSHYELHPDEAPVVRMIFERLIYQGQSLNAIAKWLNDTGVPARFKDHWDSSTIQRMINSTVYKGEFYANQYVFSKNGKVSAAGRPRREMHKRPKEEWILVEVPPIVTAEEWQLAQEALKRNNAFAMRRGRGQSWLVQGILRCDTCKSYAFVSTPKHSRKGESIRYYGCNSRSAESRRLDNSVCRVPLVRADQLEAAVWAKVQEVIYDPSIIIKRLEERAADPQHNDLQKQIDYVDTQLQNLYKERQKLEDAYNRDVYTLDEFDEKMADIRDRIQIKKNARGALEAQLQSSIALEQQKKVVIAGLARVRKELESAIQAGRTPEEIPFEMKRQILKLLVEKVWVDSPNRKFTIEGEICGTYDIDSTLTSGW